MGPLALAPLERWRPVPPATLGPAAGACCPDPLVPPAPEFCEALRAFASRIPAPAMTTTAAAAARPRSSNGEDQPGMGNRRHLRRRRSGRSGRPGTSTEPVATD